MIKNLSWQLIFFVAVFNLVSYIRELELLPTSDELQAPSFVLTTTTETTLSSQDLAGKPTLLYFWAPWCSVCKVSMPNLESFKQNNPDINVVSVVLSYETKGQVEQFLQQHDYSFTTVFGTSEVSNSYKIKGFPTYYVLNENNQVVGSSLGYSSEIGMLLRTFNI